MKKKRVLIITGLAAVLIAGGAFLSTRTTRSASSDLLADAQTATVIRTTLMTSVDSTGSIIPESEVSLSFGAAGTVEEVNVAVGDQVKQGDVLATLDATDLQLKVTQAEQAYVLQQLTYSETVKADTGDIAVAEAAYNSALASYNAARRDYNNLADKEAVQCASLTSAKTNLDRAQTAYDRLANDHQAKNYLNSDWGPFQSVVNNLTNAQSAYDQALASCNITKLSLNDSSLRSAQAQVQSAKSNLDNLVSPRAEEQIQAAAALEQSRLSLEQAKRDLASATLTAPFDGVITAVALTVGASRSNATLTMVDTSRLHVDVLVDETEIATVAIGQKATLTLDALSGITLTGEVANIDPAGTVSNGVVNYSVRVNLDPTDAPLKLDMTANAALIGEQHENVLAVPTTAIRSGRAMNRGNAQSGETGATPSSNMVMVLENGQPRPVPVTVGMTAGDLTEVSGDLQEGDQVLIVTTSSSSNIDQPGGFGPMPDGDLGGPPPDGGGGGPLGGGAPPGR
ncbi:Macrolide export protein MacA [Thermoflexales bacterium]|nr:Macrolide export protein MacA [Thermoflexales bacterium]